MEIEFAEISKWRKEWENSGLWNQGIKDHQDLIMNQMQEAWTREAEKGGGAESKREKAQLWN